MLWNERVGALGLAGWGVQVRYLPMEAGGEVRREMGLAWKGEVWEPGLEKREDS